MEIKDGEDLNVEEETVLNEEEQSAEELENSEASEQTETEDLENVQGDEEEEDRIVTIGDPPAEEEGEESHQEAPPWVKKVRKVNRQLESKVKQLERQLAEKSTEIERPVELGEKPTLASMKYDDAKYEQALLDYYERKRKVENQAAEKAKTVEEQNKVWQSRQEKYVSLKQEHSFKDFSEVEEIVSATLSPTQQGVIVKGAEDAALLVYALGKNPKKLEELAKITDPVDFIFKVAKLETQLKVTNKKAPDPEKRVSGGKAGGMGGNIEKTLEQLRAKADKDGDYSEVVAYKKKHNIE